MLIAIEGIDYSGKTIFSDLLFNRLEKKGLKVHQRSNHHLQPNKDHWKALFFDEHYPNNPIESILLSAYGHSRGFNIGKIKDLLDNGDVVIMDRYLSSFIAMQAMMVEEPYKSNQTDYLKLCFDLIKLIDLPIPDINIQFTISEYIFTSRRVSRYLDLGIKPDMIEKRSWDSYHNPLQNNLSMVAKDILKPKNNILLDASEGVEKHLDQVVNLILKDH